MDWLYTFQPPEQMASVADTVELYVFVDKYDVPHLRNSAIDTVWDNLLGEDYFMEPQLNHVPLYNDISLAFERLPETSTLCRLFVDVYCRSFSDALDDEEERGQREMVPSSFFAAVAQRHAHIQQLMSKQETIVNYELRLVNDHEHEKGNDMRNCMCEKIEKVAAQKKKTLERFGVRGPDRTVS